MRLLKKILKGYNPSSSANGNGIAALAAMPFPFKPPHPRDVGEKLQNASEQGVVNKPLLLKPAAI